MSAYYSHNVCILFMLSAYYTLMNLHNYTTFMYHMTLLYTCVCVCVHVRVCVLVCVCMSKGGSPFTSLKSVNFSTKIHFSTFNLITENLLSISAEPTEKPLNVCILTSFPHVTWEPDW